MDIQPSPETTTPSGIILPSAEKTEEKELRFSIGAQKGKVVIQFSAPVQQFTLTPGNALGWAEQVARVARALTPKPTLDELDEILSGDES